MSINEKEYFHVRSRLAADPIAILKKEQYYAEFLATIIHGAAPRIHSDFGKAQELSQFWLGYSPKQRGRKPKGTSIPWSELGDNSVASNVLIAIFAAIPNLTFPGLPYGGDIRFAVPEAFVHVDIKMTGPNDNPDEVVAPPQQVSGDGTIWNDGPQNAPFTVRGQRASMVFQPKLPPFYFLEGQVLLCLNFFLKIVYTVEGHGFQPLKQLELVCVPNGLLLFDGPRFSLVDGLFIPGKDDKSKNESDKRTRIRLEPLASLDPWRCTKLHRVGEKWIREARHGLEGNHLRLAQT